VGRPDPEFRGDGADWVLARFSEPREEVEAMIAHAADMAEAVLAEGMDATMNRFHAPVE
jgi:peptidyl-tRNA hydrolase, PTH1 family